MPSACGRAIIMSTQLLVTFHAHMVPERTQKAPLFIAYWAPETHRWVLTACHAFSSLIRIFRLTDCTLALQIQLTPTLHMHVSLHHEPRTSSKLHQTSREQQQICLSSCTRQKKHTFVSTLQQAERARPSSQTQAEQAEPART